MKRRRTLAFVILVVGVVLAGAGLARLSPLAPGPIPPAGALRLRLGTEPAHLVPAFGCPAAALAPARIAVSGDELILVSPLDGSVVRTVWPSGWVAWRAGGRAVLVSRYGAVVGREGETIEGFAGGVDLDGAFHVCIIGS